MAGGATIHQVAEKLHLSAAAVHKQLKNLESELDVPLYEKAGRRLRLTQAGEMLLPYLREAVNQCSAARAALEEWKGLRRGIVRLGAGPTMSSYVLPEILAEFRRRHSGVDFLVRTGASGELLSELRSGSLDLAMLIAAPHSEDPDIAVLAEWDFEIALVGNMPGLPRTCRLSALKNIPFILYQRGARIEASIDGYFHAHRFQPMVTMRFNSAEAIKAMVLRGIGISMLPLWAVATEIKERRLALIRQREAPLICRFLLAGRKIGCGSRASEALVTVTRSCMGRSGNWVQNRRLLS